MALAAYSFITIPEAQRIVLEHTPLLGTEQVELSAACGRTVSETITATDDLPPFPASIKDGYAVMSSDGPGEYDVIGESRAGKCDDLPVQPGTVAYITTGAPVPPGADAVIQVEDTEKLPPGPDGKPRVKILKAAKPGLDIRQIGSDIKQGVHVLQPGELIGPAEIGILATVGVVQVPVHRRPHVAITSTGDEVVEPSTAQLGPGQIRDCNRSLLAASASQAGAQVTDLGILRDTLGSVEAGLQKAIDIGADILITSGGVSMGDRDLIKPLLERSGKVHFGKVLMKPGKPLTFATVELQEGRRLLVFGLPGNPVSSFVCFNLVVVPCLRKMLGLPQPQLRRMHATTTSDIRLDHERPEYHRATLQYGPVPGAQDGAVGWYAVGTGNQISSRILSARSANALLEIPRAAGVLPAGSKVSALLIGDLRGMPVPQEVAVTEGF